MEGEWPGELPRGGNDKVNNSIEFQALVTASDYCTRVYDQLPLPSLQNFSTRILLSPKGLLSSTNHPYSDAHPLQQRHLKTEDNEFLDPRNDLVQEPHIVSKLSWPPQPGQEVSCLQNLNIIEHTL